MSKVQKQPKGSYIFREGEAAKYAYILQDGVIEIVKIGVDGEQVLAEISEKNKIFGEMALIDGQPRSAGAKAKTDVSVTLVNKAQFLDYVAKQPTAAHAIMMNLSSELRYANQIVSNFRTNDAENPNKDVLSSLNIKQKQDNSDFQDTDAIYESPPSKPLIYASIIIIGLLFTGVTFASLFSVDTTVSSRGKFTTKVPNVDVQSSSNAVVKNILVERGQLLKKGHVVAVLDEINAQTNLNQNSESLSSVEARLLRISVEQELILSRKKKLPKNLKLSPLLKNILNKRLDQYRSKMVSFQSRINKLEKEILARKEEINSASESVKITREQRELKQNIEDARKSLYDSKIGSRLNYLQARDQTLAARRAFFDARNILAQKKAALAAKRSDLSILTSDKGEFVATWASKLGEERARDEDKRIQLEQENVKLVRDMRNVEIRTAFDGIVLDIPKVTTGSIIREGDTIVTLVRVNQPLTLEIDISPKDISDVGVGAPTSVKLDTLPFQQYGDLKGSLSYVSQDTYETSLSGEKGAFYRGRVEVLPGQLSKLPSGFRLTAGMAASADMKVGKRRIMTYLLNPILKGLSSSFREPD